MRALGGLLLAAFAAIGMAQAQTKILIYVSPPMRNGFVDTSKDLADSVKDLQREFDGKKEFGLSSTRDGADVLLIVTKRFESPDGTKWVAAELHVGDFKKEFSSGFQGNPGSLRHVWGLSANAIAKDVRAWVTANRDSLIARRGRGRGGSL